MALVDFILGVLAHADVLNVFLAARAIFFPGRVDGSASLAFNMTAEEIPGRLAVVKPTKILRKTWWEKDLA